MPTATNVNCEPRAPPSRAKAQVIGPSRRIWGWGSEKLGLQLQSLSSVAALDCSSCLLYYTTLACQFYFYCWNQHLFPFLLMSMKLYFRLEDGRSMGHRPNSPPPPHAVIELLKETEWTQCPHPHHYHRHERSAS